MRRRESATEWTGLAVRAGRHPAGTHRRVPLRHGHAASPNGHAGSPNGHAASPNGQTGVGGWNSGSVCGTRKGDLGAGASRFGVVALFVRNKLGACRHELRVACLSGRLFQKTRHLHGLPRDELMTLRLGALLHDIGRHVDDDEHPEMGARLILRSRQLPLTPHERRVAAFLARYHRGPVAVGSAGDDLPAEEARTARVLLALLRAADALDSRVDGHVRVGLKVRGATVEIVAWPTNGRGKARRAVCRRKKYRLLEETLGCTVRVRVA